jgi:hypothetical protein
MFGFVKKFLILFLILLFCASSTFADRIGILNSEVDGTPGDVYAYKMIWPNGTISITNDVLTYTPAAGAGDMTKAVYDTNDNGSIDGQDADEVGISDAGGIITATDVEGALQENRTAINLNTAKPTYTEQADDPDANDDIDNFATGDVIQNTTDDTFWRCTNNSDGAATWECMNCVEQVTDGGTPSVYGSNGADVWSALPLDDTPEDSSAKVATSKAIYDERAATITLTNKTIDADDNTFQDIPCEQTFVILNPTDGDDPLVWKFKRAATITSLDCVTLGGGDIDVDMNECDANGANGASGGIAITDIGTTNLNDASFTDAVFDSGDYMKMVLTNQAGTVDQLSCTVSWKWSY